MIRQKVDVEAVDPAGIQTETLPHDLTTRYRCAARARCAGMDHFENRWWEPGALLDAAHAIRRSIPQDEFFCDSAYQPVREAIATAEFAMRRPWNRDWQVRPVLRREQFPDAELRCGNDVRPFEVVEADRENRRRCEEYRTTKGKPDRFEHYDPDKEARKAFDEIERVVRLKAAKRYSPRPNLLVYVNLSAGEPTSLYAWGLTEQFGESFQSAWLLWQSETFRLWPNPAKIKVAESVGGGVTTGQSQSSKSTSRQ